MPTVLDTATDFLKFSLEGAPPPPDILTHLDDLFFDLSAISIDPGGAGIDAWIRLLSVSIHDARLQDTLIVRAMQMRFPRLAEALILANVVTVDEWTATNTPAAFRIDWPQFQIFTTDPGAAVKNAILSRAQSAGDIKALQALFLAFMVAPYALLELEYKRQGFTKLPLNGESPSGDLKDLIDLIQSPIRIGLPPPPLPIDLATLITHLRINPTPAGSFLGMDATITNDDLTDITLEVLLAQPQVVNGSTVDLGGGWSLKFEAGGTGSQTYRIQGGPGGINTSIRPPGNLGATLSKLTPEANAWLVGEKDGTHLAIGSLGASVRMRKDGPLFDSGIRIDNIELALKPDFLSFLSFGLALPTLLTMRSSIDLSYAQGTGLSGTLDAEHLASIVARQVLPLSFKIGSDAAGVQIDNVIAELNANLGADGLGFTFSLTYTAQGQFGPLKAIMDGSGAGIGRGAGANEPFKPNGIGLSLNAGPVNGGGFLKRMPDDSFAGALQLKILGIGAFAYGLYATLPNGDISFVAMIGIRLPPPGVQLGFGFAVSGFGGLVGINRRADTDKLRERLASGSAGDVLFNDNPMANAPKLLGDMQQFFPPESGIFLIGPTLQINWLYILQLDAGVFIELPGPRKIFIAGSGRLVIGSEAFALVYIRVDFIGGIDTVKSLIFFDAALVNSHVLGIFQITGGVALRIAYGPGGYFILTVGGFHPSFNPDGMELPRVARVGTSVSIGPVWMKQEMYLAITSNTFQLGTKVEAGLELGPISAHGWFAFDALIQFKPFHFVATIDAGFDVEVEGVSICSVRVTGQLSGPGPLALQARASVKVLFVRISGSVAIELSSNPPEQINPIPDIPHHLQPDPLHGELSNPDNLRFEGKDQAVRLRPDEANAKRFTPVGTLIWEQKRTPLNLAIEKLEGVELGGWHTLTVTCPLAPPGTPYEEDWFSVGSYLKLPDGEALNNPRFAKQQSGIRAGSGELKPGAEAQGEIKLNLIKLPKIDPPVLDLIVFMYVNQFLAMVLGERSGGAKMVISDQTVKVHQETWNAHAADGAVVSGESANAVQAFVAAKQVGGFAVASSDQPIALTGVL